MYRVGIVAVAALSLTGMRVRDRKPINHVDAGGRPG